jgi:hypothetical protein
VFPIINLLLLLLCNSSSPRHHPNLEMPPYSLKAPPGKGYATFGLSDGPSTPPRFPAFDDYTKVVPAGFLVTFVSRLFILWAVIDLPST